MPVAKEAEFGQYFATRATALRRTAYLLTGNWHDAEDLVQAAFVKLYPVWSKVRTETADAYVRRVLVNTFLSSRRALRWREHPMAELPDTPAPRGVPTEDRLAVRAAMAQLTSGQRAIVVLRYWEGLSIAETAALLKVSGGTVKSQTFRALDALRTLLDEEPAPLLGSAV